jgi:hypothetical protein
MENETWVLEELLLDERRLIANGFTNWNTMQQEKSTYTKLNYVLKVTPKEMELTIQKYSHYSKLSLN